VIGMTNMPEAKLAREAEICYATVAMVTDYDCWHPGHDAVTVEMIVGVLRAILRTIVNLSEIPIYLYNNFTLSYKRECSCQPPEKMH
jgi:purine nucleoside phosphorylase